MQKKNLLYAKKQLNLLGTYLILVGNVREKAIKHLWAHNSTLSQVDTVKISLTAIFQYEPAKQSLTGTVSHSLNKKYI